MKKRLIALLAALVLLIGGTALGAGYRIADGNADNFGTLFVDLLRAYEKPSPGDDQAIREALDAISRVSVADLRIAQAITDHWNAVYVDPDGAYRLYMYGGGDRATELESSGIPDSAAHAFVVLGYELKNGEMTDELKGRCDAAAAAARSFPNAILVCSGGATGKNNPMNHTEAGLMKAYLVEQKGIDAARICIDEQAMTTVDNAVNTLKMLMRQDVQTMTIVTSSYHQRWGQVIYNAMAAICRQITGYSVEIVGNYCYEIEPSDRYRQDDRIAIRQLCSVLKLPDDIIESMKQAF